MTDVPTPPSAHPMADVVRGDLVVHHLRAPVTALTIGIADLLVTEHRAGRTVVLHGPPEARLTEALVAALRDAGGRWLVEAEDGDAWDGLHGTVVERESALLDPTSTGPLDRRFAAGGQPDALQVVLAASVRHRGGGAPRMGAFLDAAAGPLGAAPAVYGPHEPVERPWDPSELGALVAARPRVPRMLVAGGGDAPLAASLLARRTDVGFEEVVDAVVAAGPFDEAAAPALADRVAAAFAGTTDEAFPLFAFALVRPGRSDLTVEPVLRHAPAPAAVLIGPPGVRDLGVDVSTMRQSFDAIVAGRPRVPALVIPFGGTLRDWQQVERFVSLLGAERVAELFGRRLPTTPPHAGDSTEKP